jgi:outer membrane protein assembly factor BamA
VAINENADIIESRVKAAGFFRAQVNSQIDTTRSGVEVIYTVAANEPYYFDSLKICSSEQPICDTIRKIYENDPIIKYGELFRKNKLVDQRTAIADDFRNSGYYYFATQLFYYRADSSNATDRTVKLSLDMQDSIPPAALQKFTIDTVLVNLASTSKDTTVIGDSLRAIIDKNKLFVRPEKLRPFIAVRPGDLYSKAAENLTLEQLNKLDIFQFVSLEYEVDTTGGKNLLKAKILATPQPKHSLRSDLVLTTTSTNFTGPGLQLRYTNRNLFRGAEHLRISAVGRYERQLTGSRKGLTSYELNFDASLLFPRVSGPLSPKASSGNVPKTKYSLRYRLFSQPEYYAQSSLGASFGYEWLTQNFTAHDLKLIRLDYVRLIESSRRLDELFASGVLDQESFDDQLIFGPSYNIVYQPRRPDYVTNYYLGGNVEFSGNILYGAYSLIDADKNRNDQYEIVEVPFAQYARAQLDARVYFKVAEYTKLVLRQNVGVGVPYLNSSSLPFAKQFFVGGASSIRGFQPRAVGPGIYENPTEEDSFFDQTGDIMLEWNAETRFDLGGYFNVALFVDAGNVWLINETTSRPGGQFSWKNFANELAVAGGAGLRIDADFIVVRFDLALPFRNPAEPDGDRWLFDEVKLDNSWVGDNLILNFAIGYPF